MIHIRIYPDLGLIYTPCVIVEMDGKPAFTQGPLGSYARALELARDEQAARTLPGKPIPEIVDHWNEETP